MITPPSGRGLVIPFSLAPDLRVSLGQRNTRRVQVSFATQPRAFILSDRNMFYTPRGGGGTTAGSNAPGAFLVTDKTNTSSEYGEISKERSRRFISNTLKHFLLRNR